MEDKVFISYSRKDADVVDELSSLLRELNVKHFRDTKEIAWGNRINPIVNEGLQSATAILVVISSASLSSPWVLHEIGQAMALGKQVLPFLAHADVDVPDYLRDFQSAHSLDDVCKYFQDRHSNETFENDFSTANRPTVSRVTYETLGNGIREARNRVAIVDAWIARPEDICFAIKQSEVPGRSVSLLFLDPEESNSLLIQRFEDLGMKDATARSQIGLNATRDILGDDENIRVYNAIPPFNLYWFDDKMYIGFYWLTSLSAQGPFFEVDSTQVAMYGAIERSFDKLWSESKCIRS